MIKTTKKDLFDIHSKNAVVVGGASGIGKAISYAYAEFGANVSIVDINYDAALKVAEEINKTFNSFAKAYKSNVSDKQQVFESINNIKKDFGSIDIFVYSAGINFREYVVDIIEKNWDSIITVNLKGAFLYGQAVGMEMIKTGGGKIINIASVSSHLGHPKRGAYAASKGGLIQLTKVMANEWAKYNINVNAISPVAVLTPLVKDLVDTEDKMKELTKNIPMGRIAEPDDIVGTAIYLSSKASNFVTGVNIFVDGGRIID